MWVWYVKRAGIRSWIEGHQEAEYERGRETIESEFHSTRAEVPLFPLP